MRLANVARAVVPFSMPLILAAVAAAAAAPAIHVLELRGAIAFGIAIAAWLLFGRLLVFVIFGRVARDGCHVITDLIAILASIALDPRLAWGALAAILLAEAVFWVLKRTT